MANVLITGGAGFIGAQLGAELVDAGHQVRALDTLVPEVHGRGRERPAHLDERIELVIGDVRDAGDVSQALDGVDAVYHFAALVGVGPSLARIADYTSVASMGTAVLLQALLERRVERLVVASSMGVYGEGLYRDQHGSLHEVPQRTSAQLEGRRWNPVGRAGVSLVPVPTPEHKQLFPASIDALCKHTQERLCLLFGQAHHVPTVALRFANVYGRHQGLPNPDAGVIASFGARLVMDQAPRVFEDGRQRRDFIHVSDAARAARLALESPRAGGAVLNIGSGRSQTVLDVARKLAAAMGRPQLVPEVTGGYRQGDIRHCFADVDEARRVLGFEPQVSFERGVADLAGWLATLIGDGGADRMRRELEAQGCA